jgi:hypothetical protein
LNVVDLNDLALDVDKLRDPGNKQFYSVIEE